MTQNPWTEIVYSGTPHVPANAQAVDLGNRQVQLTWQTDVFGTWHYEVSAFRVGQDFVATQGPSGNAVFHFVLFPSAEFLAGSAQFTVPEAGDYWFFIRAVGWLPPFPTASDYATPTPFVTVAP